MHTCALILRGKRGRANTHTWLGKRHLVTDRNIDGDRMMMYD